VPGASTCLNAVNGEIPMARRSVIGIILVSLTLASAALVVDRSTDRIDAAAAAEGEYSGTTPARDFPSGLDWINTGGEELALERLRERRDLSLFARSAHDLVRRMPRRVHARRRRTTSVRDDPA